MKLSKALKLKNKKVTEYNDSILKMRSSNSYDIDANKNYNAKEYFEKATSQREDLIKFKTAIHTTSEPIRSKIFELSELKNFLTQFKSIPTAEGIIKNIGYSSVETSTYAVDINEREKETILKSLEERIELLQEDIDSFNATTELIGY